VTDTRRRSRLLLLRHAESRFDANTSDAGRGLSERGLRQAQALVTPLRAVRPQRLFASPYRRARDTLEPTAAALHLPVAIEPALRECEFHRAAGERWPAPIERAWAQRDVTVAGCESAAHCQRRVIECLRRLLSEHPQHCLLIASHGNAIALTLNFVDSAFDFAAWKAMPMPALFEVDLAARVYRGIDLGL
jgi:2,3-bisphosphoglycerate-dependent phosphoglycerate mutase